MYAHLYTRGRFLLSTPYGPLELQKVSDLEKELHSRSPVAGKLTLPEIQTNSIPSGRMFQGIVT